MNPTIRARLAAGGVLSLMLVTGFLLGIAWERTEDARAGESVESEVATGASEQGPPPIVDLSGEDSAEVDDDSREVERGRDRRRSRPLIVHGVGIDDEQERRAYELVDLHRERWRALSDEMEEEYDPRFRALNLQIRQSIRALLSEEQALRYDSLLAAHDRRQAQKR